LLPSSSIHANLTAPAVLFTTDEDCRSRGCHAPARHVGHRISLRVRFRAVILRQEKRVDTRMLRPRPGLRSPGPIPARTAGRARFHACGQARPNAASGAASRRLAWRGEAAWSPARGQFALPACERAPGRMRRHTLGIRRRASALAARPKHERGLAESEQAAVGSYFCSPRKAGVSSSRSTSLSKIVQSATTR